jgi:hypothetical protein
MVNSIKIRWAALACAITSIFIGAGCGFNEPKVLPSIQLTNVTDGEYAKVKAKNAKIIITKQDLRKVFIDIVIDNTDDLEDIKIDIPDVNKILDTNKQKKISANTEELIFNSKKEKLIMIKSYVFNYKGLSEADVRKLLKGAVIQVSWLEDGKRVMQSFELDKLITPRNYYK